MCLVRKLVITCLRFNILFQAQHIPGKANVLAYHLSRLQVGAFLAKAPSASRQPEAVPPLPHLQSDNYTCSLTTTLAALVDSALAPASRACYPRGWNLYIQFAQKYPISEQFPVRVSNLALFIAYLVSQSYKPSTISSYVSAIGCVHKLKAIPDPTSPFLILKLLHARHK